MQFEQRLSLRFVYPPIETALDSLRQLPFLEGALEEGLPLRGRTLHDFVFKSQTADPRTELQSHDHNV